MEAHRYAGLQQAVGACQNGGPLIVLQVAVVIPAAVSQTLAAGGAGHTKVREAQVRIRVEGVRSTMRTCRPGAGPITMGPSSP